MEDGGARQLPLSVVMEGQSWLLTASMATLMCILVVMYQYDGATDWALDRRLELPDGWGYDLANFLILIAVAFVSALIATCAISLNISPPGTAKWRMRMCLSVTGMTFIHFLVLNQISASLENLRNIPGRSDAAHIMLLVAAFSCLIMTDVLFTMMFGCCTCCHCSRRARYGKRGLQEDLPVARVMDDTGGNGEGSCSSPVDTAECSDSAEASVSSKARLERWDTQRVRTKWESDVAYDPERHLKRAAAKRKIEMQDILKNPILIGHKSVEVFRNAWGGLSTWFKKKCHNVSEEPGKFQYSVWVKAAMLASVIVLLYNCVKTVDVLSRTAGNWDNYKARAVTLTGKAEEAVFNQTRGNFTIDDAVDAAKEAVKKRAADIPGRLSGLVLQNINITASNITEQVVFLNQKAVLHVLEYLDTFLPKFRVTVFFGYPMGTYLGLRVLYHVCAQYKSMSIRLALEIKQKYGDRSHLEPSWFGLEKKYPVGVAVFFFGTLTSTAAIQQQIFGFIFSVLFAMVANGRHVDVLMTIFGSRLLVMLSVFVFNFLIIRYVGNNALSDGFRIKHPHRFFVYMFVFSMVHLVLGIFYALYRLIFLLITTFLVLSRLDVSVFFTGKSLDNGHNAFMAMLLLTQVIQQDVRMTGGSNGQEGAQEAPNSGDPNREPLTSGEWNLSGEQLDAVQEEVSRSRRTNAARENAA